VYEKFVTDGFEPPVFGWKMSRSSQSPVATALAALQQDNWVGEIGQGLTTVTVVVQQPPVRHEVKMKDFLSWLGREGGSPAEIILRQTLGKMLGMAKQARK